MISRLLSGFLVLTYNCNNRCKWCYASPAGFKKRIMEFSKSKKYLLLMKKLGIKSVGLLGGEPTLYPRLFDLIKFAKEQDIKVTLYTNGRKLSDEKFVKNLKEAGLDFINVTIQSGSKHYKEHDKTVNVKGAWKECKQGIENCFKQGIKVNIQTILAHTDFKIYKEILEEFNKNNLFIFYREIPPVNLKCNFFQQKVLSNQDTKEIYKKIFIFAKNKGIRTYLFARMPLCWWNSENKIEKVIQNQTVAHCHIINGSVLAIDFNGKVLACPIWIGLHSMSLIKNGGIILKNEFLRKFNKGIPEQIRKKISYVPHKTCLNCKFFGKRCTGGCPLVKFELGPYA